VERYREAFDALSALPPEQRVPELREALLTQYSSQLLKTPDPEGVVEVLRSRLAQAGGLTASLHFTLGLALIQQRRFSEAAEQMRECLAKRQQRALVPIHKDLHRGGPSHCLALCAQKLGQTDAAEAAFRQALEENPRARAIRIGYANFLAEQGQPVAALHQLHGVIQDQPEAAAAWIRGGQIALSRPEFLEVARDWTAEALQHCPIDATLRAQRVEALLKSQQVEEALEVARTTAAPMDAKLAAARALCELASGRALTAPASNTTDVNQEFLNWYRSLLEAGAESVVTRVNERLPVLRQRLPLAAQRIAAALREAQGEVAA
jgi:tetratricopeptide (TPR) repeat protein